LKKRSVEMAENNPKQIESIEHIPASDQHSFPPFDKQTFPSQLVWLALTFGALYLLMSRIALPRISSILEERRKHIENELAGAQRAKGESDAAAAAHEQVLAEARGRAQTLANEIRARAAVAAEARRKEVDAKLDIRVSEAQQSLAAAQSAAMAHLHEMAGDAAGAIVERLTGVAPTKQDVADAIATMVKRQEVGS
jgi:F-type H+-transporting ATPase subunit b